MCEINRSTRGFFASESRCAARDHAVISEPSQAVGKGAICGALCVAVAHTVQTVAGVIRLGLLPGWGGTQRLTRLVGRNRAKHGLMTGERLSAAQAGALGIVARVVPDETVLDEARRPAASLAESAPLAIRGIKRAVEEGTEIPLHTALRIEQTILLAEVERR